MAVATRPVVVPANERGHWLFGSLPMMVGTLICVILSGAAIAIILSLIPVYLPNAGDGIVNRLNRVSGPIPVSFFSNWVPAPGQSTTITNTGALARQLEQAYGLPSGSLQISGVQVYRRPGNSGRRRRRRELYRKKRAPPTCESAGSPGSVLKITLYIIFPSKIVNSATQRQKFYNRVISALQNTSPSFPFTLQLSDGSSVAVVMYACIQTSEFSAPFTTTTTTLSLVCSLQWVAAGTTVAGSAAGAQGTTASLLTTPQDVALDASNTLYISDNNAANGRVLQWVSGAAAGTPIMPVGTFTGTPEGVAVGSNGVVYVVDPRAAAAAQRGNIYTWTANANAPVLFFTTGLANAWGIAVDVGNNRFFVSNAAAANANPVGNVWQYDLNPAGGNAVQLFGAATSPFTIANPLDTPKGIYYDSTSNSLLIANAVAAGYIIRCYLTLDLIQRFTRYTDANGNSVTFNTPSGVTMDSMGNIYVAATGNNLIALIRAGQTVGTAIAGTGAAPAVATATVLSGPFSVKVDSQGNLYVADTGYNRIQLFTCIQTQG